MRVRVAASTISASMTTARLPTLRRLAGIAKVLGLNVRIVLERLAVEIVDFAVAVVLADYGHYRAGKAEGAGLLHAEFHVTADDGRGEPRVDLVVLIVPGLVLDEILGLLDLARCRGNRPRLARGGGPRRFRGMRDSARWATVTEWL